MKLLIIVTFLYILMFPGVIWAGFALADIFKMSGMAFFFGALLPIVFTSLFPLYAFKLWKKGEMSERAVQIFTSVVFICFALSPIQTLIYGVVSGLDRAGFIIFLLIATIPVAGLNCMVLMLKFSSLVSKRTSVAQENVYG